VTRYDDVKRYLEDDEHLSLEMQADRLRDTPHDIPETENMMSDDAKDRREELFARQAAEYEEDIGPPRIRGHSPVRTSAASPERSNRPAGSSPRLSVISPRWVAISPRRAART